MIHISGTQQQTQSVSEPSNALLAMRSSVVVTLWGSPASCCVVQNWKFYAAPACSESLLICARQGLLWTNIHSPSDESARPLKLQLTNRSNRIRGEVELNTVASRSIQLQSSSRPLSDRSSGPKKNIGRHVNDLGCEYTQCTPPRRIRKLVLPVFLHVHDSKNCWTSVHCFLVVRSQTCFATET